MNVDYLVFFDKQLIGVVSKRADDYFLARSVHKPRRCQFRTRQQATLWVNGTHTLATCHWDLLKATFPTAIALYAAYGALANDGQLFIPTEQVFAIGDKVLLELAHENRRYYALARIVFLNPEPSAQFPKGVGLEAIFRDQLRKRLAKHQSNMMHSDSLS